MKRKAFLRASAAMLGGALLPDVVASAQIPKPDRQLLVRFAHLTDIHVRSGNAYINGAVRAFRHVNNLTTKVDFIVNGGDLVMDVLHADKKEAESQWGIAQKILSGENALQVHHCIGNHDIWGWFTKGKVDASEPLYGKEWAINALRMPNRYHSFENGKWRFFVLDSVQFNPIGGYFAKVDAEQMAWLSGELEATAPDQFVCIVSHVPILSVCAGLYPLNPKPGGFTISQNLLHSDFRTLKNLFKKYPNVKVCISGHIHMQDQLEYLGVKYYCNGAVSGNWWKGPYHEFKPAYAVIELYDDGTSERTMIDYANQ